MNKMSEREQQWWRFAEEVATHLREYTVPQYGDVGEDEITNYTSKDCVEHIKRYVKRHGSQSREGQQVLDFLKIAHYAQCASEKHINRIPEVQKGIQGRLVVVDSEEDLILYQSGEYELDCIVNDQDGTTFNFWKNKEQ